MLFNVDTSAPAGASPLAPDEDPPPVPDVPDPLPLPDPLPESPLGAGTVMGNKDRIVSTISSEYNWPSLIRYTNVTSL